MNAHTDAIFRRAIPNCDEAALRIGMSKDARRPKQPSIECRSPHAWWILGLLAERPMTAPDVKATPGYAASESASGKTLKMLADFVPPHATRSKEATGRRAWRYTITDEGRAALAKWRAGA